jgi:hypothetical protein
MARKGVQHVEAAEARRLRTQPGATLALDLTRKAVAFGLDSDIRVYRLPDGRVLLDQPSLSVVYDSEAALMAVIGASPEQSFVRPWPERRGNDAYDGNYSFAAVKAPAAQVTATLAANREGTVWDAIGRDVPASPAWMLVVRIEGHPWTLVIDDVSGDGGRLRADLDELSRAAGVQVFHFAASDTMGSVGYQLMEGGTEIEHFEAANDAVESFRSSRGTEAPAPDELNDFVETVVVALDLYLPSISADYFFGQERPARGRWQVRNPGLVMVGRGGKELTTVPPFESVDYVWGKARLDA